eukprot:8708826-Prorocentrum_lima.AAC.1
MNPFVVKFLGAVINACTYSKRNSIIKPITHYTVTQLKADWQRKSMMEVELEIAEARTTDKELRTEKQW